MVGENGLSPFYTQMFLRYFSLHPYSGGEYGDMCYALCSMFYVLCSLEHINGAGNLRLLRTKKMYVSV